MNPVAKSIYRILIRRTRILDKHCPLKLLMSRFDSKCNTFIDDAFKFYSIRYEPELYDSSHSLYQHIRITFDFIKMISKNPSFDSFVINENYLNESYLIQIGFNILKVLSTALELINFIEYDIKYIESLPESKIIPPRLSDPIQNDLLNADDDTINNINEACMYIKLANACSKIEDRISYYVKSINAYETADGYTYLGWMIYTLSMQKETKDTKTKKNIDQESNESNTMKMAPLLDVIGTDIKRIQNMKDEILEYDDNILRLNGDDAMLFCMKCDRIASLIDPSFGNCWNDLGVCLMNKLFMSDQSEKALQLFDTAKSCNRYSSREFPFLNSARLYLRYKKDIIKAIKEYLGALYFNRDETEAIMAIKDYLGALILFMNQNK